MPRRYRRSPSQSFAATPSIVRIQSQGRCCTNITREFFSCLVFGTEQSFDTIDKYSTIWYLCLTLHYPLQDVIKKRTMWDGSPRDLHINLLPNAAMEVSEKKNL